MIERTGIVQTLELILPNIRCCERNNKERETRIQPMRTPPPSNVYIRHIITAPSKSMCSHTEQAAKPAAPVPDVVLPVEQRSGEMYLVLTPTHTSRPHMGMPRDDLYSPLYVSCCVQPARTVFVA